MERVELNPPGGHRLVADHVTGVGNHPPWVYVHGLASVRIGEKSLALKERAARHGVGWLTYDQPGHGDSTGELLDGSLGDLVAALGTVLEHTGPAVLFGSSLGGLVSAWAAARHPERVRAMVLLAPAFGFLHRMARGEVRSVVAGDQGEVAFSEKALADAGTFPEAELPGAIQCPTLVCHGSEDEVVPFQESVRFCGGLNTKAKGWTRHLPDRDPLWILAGEDHRLNQPIQVILDRSDEMLGTVGLLPPRG